MTKKPLILAFSLAAGLMSSTAMAADFSATSSMSREVTPIMINGVRDLAIWDSNGSVADPKETLGQLASDKLDTFGRVSPARADSVDAGSALVATILAETKSDKADLVRPALAEGLTVPRTDKYDVTAVATVALAAPLVKVDTSRVDAIKYAEFDRADAVAADKAAPLAAADVVAARADTTKVGTKVVDSRVSATAIKEIKSVEVAVVVDQASTANSIRVASLSRSDLVATRTDVAAPAVKDTAALEKELDAIRSRADAINKEIEALKAKSGDKGADVDALNKQIEAYRTELVSLKDKYDSIKSDILGTKVVEAPDRTKVNADVQKQLNEITAESDSLNKKIEELKAKAGDKGADVDAINKQIDDYKSQITELSKKYDTIKADALVGTRYTDKLERVENAAPAVSNEEIASLKTKVDDMNKQIDEWKAMTSEKGADVDALNKKIDAYNEEIAKLKSEIDGLQSADAKGMETVNAGVRDMSRYDRLSTGVKQDNVASGITSKIDTTVFSNVLGNTERLGFSVMDGAKKAEEKAAQAAQEVQEVLDLKR